MPGTPEERGVRRTYFSELLMLLKLVFRVEPRPLTAAMIASAIPAAIRPYSIAVAPDWSDKNFKKMRCNAASVSRKCAPVPAPSANLRKAV